MTEYFPPIPDDDAELITMDVEIHVVSPKTLLGWLGMKLFMLATKLGVEPQLVSKGVTERTFGEMPTPIRDKMVADLLAGEFVKGTRVRRTDTTPEENDDDE